MREVLIARMRAERAQAVRQWLHSHWQERGVGALALYQRWQMEPREALDEWRETHEALLKSQRVPEARAMLDWWDDVEWDERERQRLGDVLWAEVNFVLGVAFWETPTAERARTLQRAISYFLSALQVFTQDAYPEDWARTQVNLGVAYYEWYKTTQDAQYLRLAIEHLRQALEGFRAVGDDEGVSILSELIAELEEMLEGQE